MNITNLNDIKKKIVEANKAYREGQPFLTDQEYDDLLESLKTEMSEEDYEEFVSTLNEGAIEKNVDGKVKHPFILGSLTKLKSEEPDVVLKWIKENVKNMLSVSAKVDGISSRAEYKNGKLVSLTTRGDGYFGQDITSKAKYIKHLPKVLTNGHGDFTGNIRGELVLMCEDFESIKDKYANPRNAVAGIMNRKEVNIIRNGRGIQMIGPFCGLGGSRIGEIGKGNDFFVQFKSNCRVVIYNLKGIKE